MISILIATYNYDAYPLVKQLHAQCRTLNITYEIIVWDDGSQQLQQNEKLKELEHCLVKKSAHNLGLASTRNLLLSHAQYDWCLLLDSDTAPVGSDFISQYLQATHLQKPVIYGGLAYENTEPPADEKLRWVYGKNREQLTVEQRSRRKSHFLCSNVVLHKRVTKHISFDSSITSYGYEDLVFNVEVASHGFEVAHIDNPVFHLKLDKSVLFLKKTQTALLNLIDLMEQKKINPKEIHLIVFYEKLKIIGLHHFLAYLGNYAKVIAYLEKKLLAQNPDLRWFDLYKLLLFSAWNKASH